MKLTHATWEKRNIGLDCYEVVIEAGDNADMLRERAPEFETDYTVVKVPVGRVDISFYLQSAGYRFVEVITTCHHDGKLPTLPRVLQRIIDTASYAEMDAADLDEAFAMIRGGMFDTDRVSLDPYFTREQATGRYIGWIQDEIARGSQMFKLVFKGRNAGFFNLRNVGNQTVAAAVGGVYPEFQKAGLGVCLNYFEIVEGVRQGARRIVTSFSSNNRGAAAIHFLLGYGLGDQYYVFIKHEHPVNR